MLSIVTISEYADFSESLKILIGNSPHTHRYPDKFLKEIAMDASQFSFDIFALALTYVLLKVICYYILKWRIVLSR